MNNEFTTDRPLSRRDMLARCGGGAGMLGLAALMSDNGMLDASAQAASLGDRSLNPMASLSCHCNLLSRMQKKSDTTGSCVACSS